MLARGSVGVTDVAVPAADPVFLIGADATGL